MRQLWVRTLRGTRYHLLQQTGLRSVCGRNLRGYAFVAYNVEEIELAGHKPCAQCLEGAGLR